MCIKPYKKQIVGLSQQNIPDGIYIIRYSVSPNSKVYVEYNHLRVTRLLTTYYEVLCDLDVQACQPDSRLQDIYAEMSYIRTMIDAAVSNVEYCESPAQGMQIYNYAKTRLNKISLSIQVTVDQAAKSFISK